MAAGISPGMLEPAKAIAEQTEDVARTKAKTLAWSKAQQLSISIQLFLKMLLLMSPRLPTAWQGPAPLHSPSSKAAIGFFINLTELAGKNRDIFWHSLDAKGPAQSWLQGWGSLGLSAGAAMPGSQLSSPKPRGCFYPCWAFSAKIIWCCHLTRDTAQAHEFSDVLLKKCFLSKISCRTQCQ